MTSGLDHAAGGVVLEKQLGDAFIDELYIAILLSNNFQTIAICFFSFL